MSKRWGFARGIYVLSHLVRELGVVPSDHVHLS